MRETVWLVKDNELGEIFRFRTKTSNSYAALKLYLQRINPELTEQEADDAVKDFNGEIWAAKDIKDIFGGL